LAGSIRSIPTPVDADSDALAPRLKPRYVIAVHRGQELRQRFEAAHA
jgi:hypothetical protein